MLLIGAGCSQNQNNNTINQATNAVKNTADAVVRETIDYGTSMSKEAIEHAKADCAEKGGELNECGSICGEGETCATVCSLVCEFE